MYTLLRHILFTLPPETAHHISLQALNYLAHHHILKRKAYVNNPIKLMGLEFNNRLGVAAGLDKNGDYIEGLASLGFAFLELGTVTPKPQAGNPKPRLFRIPKACALINRMGFNNKGVDYLIEKIKQHSSHHIVLGVNIGKNAITSNEQAIQDYMHGLTTAYPWADYITINISSPNTAGLRDLQQGNILTDLLKQLKEQQQYLSEQTQIYRPILVKIAPDLSDDQIKFIAEQLQNLKIDGVIATNTTINHNAVAHYRFGQETGGLSGKPLMEQATHVVSLLRSQVNKNYPIIAVGGIFSAQDAKTKLAAGANLLQIYTGFIYRGPALVKEIINMQL